MAFQRSRKEKTLRHMQQGPVRRAQLTPPRTLLCHSLTKPLTRTQGKGLQPNGSVTR